MTTRSYSADERAVGRGTLVEVFFDAIDRHGQAPAFQYMVSESEVRDLSYLDAHRTVKRLCGGLRAMGLQRGDRVAILSENRPEWALADYACLCSGLIPVPVYPSLLPPQVAYILENSGAALLFASSPALMAKGLEAAGAVKTERGVKVVVFDEVRAPPEGVVGWMELLEQGDPWASDTADADFRAEVSRRFK